MSYKIIDNKLKLKSGAVIYYPYYPTMRIKEVPEGSKIICCGATAEVLKHGPMGTRVNVLKLKKVDYPGFALGLQIWSSLSDVTIIKKSYI